MLPAYRPWIERKDFSDQAAPDGDGDGVELRRGVEFLRRAPNERLDRRLA